MTSLIRPSRRRKHRQRGQAMLESALVFLVFIVIIFGLMDFGRMVWIYTMISNGAREATRYAIVRGTSSGHTATVAQIQAIVLSTSPGVDSANTTTTVTFSPSQAAGSTVQVAVSYKCYPIGPYIPVGPITLDSTSKLTIYQ